ncbi:hypothetical protein BJV78DRAFT_1154823 [Lactifluus subvellereus]|nr:hypothetical protein BJV78DRAFT_1154823 [Lactifluus subvellereus]
MPMKLTQEASSTILGQCQVGSHGGELTRPLNVVTIQNLPAEVLLEIFDSYRQHFKHSPGYEKDWNRKGGWFMLAHVCHQWRHIVLVSSSRLDLRLFLTVDTPMKAVLKRLPPLPIVVHYNNGARTAKDMDRMITAIQCRDRVRGITFQGKGARLAKFFRVMKGFLPRLESLKLSHEAGLPLVLPTTFLRGSAPNLRLLKLKPVSLSSLSQLLSSATGLIDLSLELKTNSGPLPTTSLLVYLQGMPSLRRLQLYFPSYFRSINDLGPSTKTDNIVALSNLTSFHYSGRGVFFEALIAGLATPSLQECHAVITDYTPALASHLSRFINDVEKPIFAV